MLQQITINEKTHDHDRAIACGARTDRHRSTCSCDGMSGLSVPTIQNRMEASNGVIRGNVRTR